MNNRILAMLLAIIMIVSIVPVNAFAAEIDHAEGCEYRAPCTCENVTTHTFKVALGGGCEGYPCTKDCANNATPTPTPVVPGEHTHKDENGAVGGGPNGVCDISGCKEHVHKIETVPAVEPTCTEGGNYAYRKCVFCKEVFKGETGTETGAESDYIRNPEAANHKLTLVEAKDSTCTEQGNVAYYVCELCDKYFEATDSTQEIQNKTHVKRPLAEHDWKDGYSHTDATGHYQVCEACGAHGETEKHAKFSYKDGKKICGYCGYWYNHTCVDKNPVDCKCDGCDTVMHTMTYKEAVEAQCNAEGCDAYYYCEVCKLPYADEDGLTAVKWVDLVREELGHDYTYTARAYGDPKHDSVCNRCGKVTEGEHTDYNSGDHICNKCGVLIPHDGSMLKTIQESPATCTKPGLAKHFQCTNAACGHLFDEAYQPVEESEIAVLKALDHDLIAEYEKDEDNHWQLCRRSGCYDHVNVEAHAYGEWTPTELNEETHHVRYCECGYYEVSEHNFEVTVKADNDSTHTMTCSDCGYEKVFPCEAGSNHVCTVCETVVKHSGGNLTTIAEVPATCTQKGKVQHFQCTSCKKFFVKDGSNYVVIDEAAIPEIAPLGHDLIDQLYFDATGEEDGHWQLCRRKGCYDHVNVEAHEMGNWAPTEANTETHHVRYCECGYREVAEHNFEVSAKGDNANTHTLKCVDCGYTKDEGCEAGADHVCKKCQVVVKHNGDVLTTIQEVPATCTQPGLAKHYRCTSCSRLFVNGENGYVLTTADQITVLPALGHEAAPGDEPQCFLNGQFCGAHYDVCMRCRKILPVAHKDENGDCVCDISGVLMHSHELITVPEKAATCLEDGHRAYTYYEGCGKVVGEKVILGATGHDDHGEYEPLDKDTHGIKCLDCGELLEETIGNHYYEDNVLGCDACGAQDEILVHVPAVEATCTESGTEEYWMSNKNGGRCYYDEFGSDPIYDMSTLNVAALGHDWCEEPESYGVSGHRYSCVRDDCDATKNESHTNALGGTCFCDKCGDLIAGHNHEVIEAEEPDCENEGQLAAIYCDECDKYLDPDTYEEIEDIVIPALGHNLTEFRGNGKKHSASCQNDGCDYVVTENCQTGNDNCFCDTCDAPMHGNSYVRIDFIAPTCTKNGQRAALYCEKCDNYYQISTHELIPSVVIPARGHDYEAEWYNDVREGTHSKDCLRYGCHEKISEAHDLTAYDLYAGNLHEWRCKDCTYKESDIHADKNGDSICDECGHGSNKAVDASDLDNPRETVTIKVDKDATTQEKQNTWWNNFVGKLNPSYVGESQSSSAPSTNVENPLPNGSGVSSGTTSGASQNTVAAPSSSTIGSVVNFLMNLLSTLFGI